MAATTFEDDDLVNQFYSPTTRSSTPTTDISNESVISKNSTDSKAASTILKTVIFEPRPKFTIYKINVNKNAGDGETAGNYWYVYRRYSDFVLLNKKLQKLFPNLILNLPPKRWFRDNFNRNFIQKRQKGLEEFMSNLFALKQLYHSAPVQRFFRFDNPPDPSENLEMSRSYCQSLEQSCYELKRFVNHQKYEITRLTHEMEESTFHQSKIDSDKNTATTELLLAKSHLEQQIVEQNILIEQKNKELTRLAEEYRQADAFANATRMNERQKKDHQIREQGKVFREKQEKVDELFNVIATSLSDLGKVKIDVGGKSIDLKPVESIGDKENELRKALRDSRQQLECLYKDHIEFYCRELEDNKVKMAKTERTLQNLQIEANSLKNHLTEAHERHSHEIKSRDLCIHQLQNQLCSQTHYIAGLEQKYFYSLMLGVKLNLALYENQSECLNNSFEPAKLFLDVRDSGINIEHWPSWIARKLSTVVD